jgi:hypothetical protein
MAMRFVNANCATSTSATNCKKVVAGYLGSIVGGTQPTDDINTTRTTGNFTATAGESIQGAYVCLRRTTLPSGTFTVKLMEGATERATTASINASTLGNGTGWYYFAFSTPYTAAGATNYQIRMNASVVAQIMWIRGAAVGSYGYAVISNGDDATGYTSGDTLLLKNGITFTVDANMTLAATDTVSINLGDASTLTIPNPASPILLDLGAGCIPLHTNTHWLIGSVGTPVAKGRVTVRTSSGVLMQMGYLLYETMDDTIPSNVAWYGVGCTTNALKVTATTAIGQTVLPTEAVPATWTDGDTVVLFGKTGTANASDTQTYTITKGSNQITINPALAHEMVINGVIMNRSEALRESGIFMDGPTGGGAAYLFTSGTSSTVKTLKLSGCFMGGFSTGSVTDLNLSCVAGDWGMTNVYFRYYGTNVALNWAGGVRGGHNIENVTYDVASANANGLSITLKNATINKLYSRMGSRSDNVGILGNSIAITNSVFTGKLGSSYGHYFSGSNLTITDCVFVGTIRTGQGPITMTRCQQSYALGDAGLVLVNSVVNATACTFGSIGLANTVRDVSILLDSYGEGYFDGCSMGTPEAIATNCIPGSFLQFHNLNGVTGRHKTWRDYGLFDTTTPYTNMLQTAITTGVLTHDYRVSSGAVASTPFYLAAVAQVPAGYYAGAHTAPKIDLYADTNLTTPLATLNLADNNSSLQSVAVDFTPTTNNNLVHLFPKTNTAATGANGTCTWTSVNIRARTWGKVFYDYSIPISETLTYPAVSIAPVVDDIFITESVRATVDAYTGITFDSSGNLTLSVSHSIKEIYDWVKSYYAKTAQRFQSVPLRTSDGVNYQMAGNITLGASVVLSGTGEITLATGKTLTMGSGAKSSIIFDTDAGRTGALLIHLPLASMALCVQDDASADVECLTGQTGDYLLFIPAGETGTWSWAVNKQGYSFATGTFTLVDGGLFEFSPACPQVLTPEGAPMYQGTTSALVNVEQDGVYAHIDIGDGTPSVQNIYDAAEDWLATDAGIDWIIAGGDGISIFNSFGGDFIFETDNWRIHRWHAGDTKATVPAFVQSTQGIPVDESNGTVQYLTSDNPTAVAAAVWAAVSEGLQTYGKQFRDMRAVLLGVTTGGGTTSETFMAADGVTPRVVSQNDGANRTAETVPGS